MQNEKIKCKECGNPCCQLKGKDVLVPYCNEHTKIKNGGEKNDK